jgi:hypothetical protein
MTGFIGSLELPITQAIGKFSRPTPNDRSGDAIGDYFYPTTASNVPEADDQEYAGYPEGPESPIVPEDTENPEYMTGMCYLTSDLLSPATYEKVCLSLHCGNIY